MGRCIGRKYINVYFANMPAEVRGSMKNEIKIYFIMTLVVALFFAAANAFAVSVTPGKADFTVPAGQGCVTEFVITNTEPNPIDIKVSFKDQLRVMPEAVGINERGTRVATLTDKEYLLSKCIKVSPVTLTLLPAQTGRVALEILMPDDARGEYYGSIFFNTMPSGPKDEKPSVGIASNLGMAVYVAIKGTEIYKYEIEKFEVLSAAPLKFKLDVKNLGNAHIRPDGYVEFKSDDGREAFKIDLNAISAPILPDMMLDLGSVKSERKLTEGEYTAFIHLKYMDKGVIDKEIKFRITSDEKVEYKG